MIYKRLLDPTKLGPNFKQSLDRVMDVRECKQLDIDMRVLKGGTAGNFYLEHAAVAEFDAFVLLEGTSVSLDDNVGPHHISLSSFLGFIRVVGDDGIVGDPVALVDVIGRS